MLPKILVPEEIPLQCSMDTAKIPSKNSMGKPAKVPDHVVFNKNLHFKRSKNMLDRDLALLYGVEPTGLREQVKRNEERFPFNFMFQLNQEEVGYMVSQNAIPSRHILAGTYPMRLQSTAC
jgi:hypothetical protein